MPSVQLGRWMFSGVNLTPLSPAGALQGLLTYLGVGIPCPSPCMDPSLSALQSPLYPGSCHLRPLLLLFPLSGTLVLALWLSLQRRPSLGTIVYPVTHSVSCITDVLSAMIRSVCFPAKLLCHPVSLLCVLHHVRHCELPESEDIRSLVLHGAPSSWNSAWHIVGPQ